MPSPTKGKIHRDSVTEKPVDSRRKGRDPKRGHVERKPKLLGGRIEPKQGKGSVMGRGGEALIMMPNAADEWGGDGTAMHCEVNISKEVWKGGEYEKK